MRPGEVKKVVSSQPATDGAGVNINRLTGLKQITRINHVGLRVRNLGKAREFYEKLGFEFIVGPIGPEPVAVMEHPSGININFILNASEDASDKNLLMDVPEKHTGFTHIALEITDRGEVERHLTAAGIPITETVELPDGTVFFFVRDPDGNVIEFHRPA
jgi:lactoylglutathione lyase